VACRPGLLLVCSDFCPEFSPGHNVKKLFTAVIYDCS
jgi:hypothetical protein